MGLKQTRKLLSALYAMVIAIGVIGLLGTAVLNSTFGSQRFMQQLVDNKKTVAACEAQLTAKYEALSAQCGIPAHVFEAFYAEKGIADLLKSAYTNIFNEDNSTLYSPALVEAFEGLCKQYLKGNSLPYKAKNVARVAEEAARIFSETVGLHGVDSFGAHIMKTRKAIQMLLTVFAAFIVVNILMLSLLYENNKKSWLYVSYGVAGGAVGALISAVFCFVQKPLTTAAQITPAVYQDTLMHLEQSACVFMGIAALFVGVAAYIIMGKLQKDIERYRED